jgi:hypothetical protein
LKSDTISSRPDEKGEIVVKYEEPIHTSTQPDSTAEEAKARIPFFAKKLGAKSLRVKTGIKAGEESSKNPGP